MSMSHFVVVVFVTICSSNLSFVWTGIGCAAILNYFLIRQQSKLKGDFYGTGKRDSWQFLRKYWTRNGGAGFC